jgi:hypothetical protein
MTASSRTDKLFAALTAKERGLLVLRAWKAGDGEEDRQVRETMPDSQVAEFNELIEILNGVNERLGPYTLLLRATVEKLGLISGWLATIELWGNQVVELASFIFRLVPEPITESDYQRLKKRRRQPRPEWGLRFEPLPDGQAAEVKRIRGERADVIKTIQKAPWGGLVDESSDEKPGFGDRIRTALIGRLKDGWLDRYSEMLAIESFLVEAAEAFDGEDPAIPEVRAILDWMPAYQRSPVARSRRPTWPDGGSSRWQRGHTGSITRRHSPVSDFTVRAHLPGAGRPQKMHFTA